MARFYSYPTVPCDRGENIALRLPEIGSEYDSGEEYWIAEQRTGGAPTWF
jgi:hypothetical protein